MAIQLSTAARTAMAAAIETEAGASAKLKLFTGAVPANCTAADPSGELITISLPSDWATQSNGQLLKNGTWSGTASAGSGATPASFRLYKSDGSTCVTQGSAGIGSGDLQVDGTITSGQTVTVSTFTLTIGGA